MREGLQVRVFDELCKGSLRLAGTRPDANHPWTLTFRMRKSTSEGKSTTLRFFDSAAPVAGPFSSTL